MKLAEALTVEDVTDEQVRQREREAAEARDLAEAIRNRIADGADVEPGELAAARDLAEYADERARGTAAKAERAREARRLRALADLRDDIAAHTSTLGGRLADQLRKVEQELTAAVAIIDEHNARVSDWHEQAMALGAPRGDGYNLDDTSATVGIEPSGAPICVWAEGRQHTATDPRGWIGRTLARVRVHGSATALSLDASTHGVLPDQVYDDLRRFDTEEA